VPDEITELLGMAAAKGEMIGDVKIGKIPNTQRMEKTFR